MPTYNQAKFLPRALASYRAQQGVGKVLAVVDDGSTDGTAGAMERECAAGDIKVWHGANQGTAAAINSGIAALRDEPLGALTWISSDNAMLPGWLSYLAGVLDRGDVGAAYGGFNYVRPDGRKTYMFVPHERDKLVNQRDCYYGPAFLIRRDVWQSVGGHRGKISHDYDHWARVEECCYALKLKIVGVDAPMCDYDAHDARVTITRAHEYDAPAWQQAARERRGIK